LLCFVIICLPLPLSLSRSVVGWARSSLMFMSHEVARLLVHSPLFDCLVGQFGLGYHQVYCLVARLFIVCLFVRLSFVSLLVWLLGYYYYYVMNIGCYVVVVVVVDLLLLRSNHAHGMHYVPHFVMFPKPDAAKLL
jgi:hypothetical protein